MSSFLGADLDTLKDSGMTLVIKTLVIKAMQENDSGYKGHARCRDKMSSLQLDKFYVS